MRKLWLVLSLVVIAFGFAQAQAVIKLDEKVFDFGEIKQGDVVTHVFSFTNTGTAPLVISTVQTTCGCTAPQYSKDPIAPGAKGSITITFNSAGKVGLQTKVITIVSNASVPNETVTITGTVK